MINTVIFDLFGTLVRLDRDTNPFLKLAKTSNNLSVREAIDLALVKPFSSLKAYADFIKSKDATDDLETMLVEDITTVELFHDVLDTLEYLKREGFRLAVISNLATPYKRVLSDTGIQHYFDVCVFSCDEGVRKPNPAIYKVALERLGISPNEAIMIGDSFVSDVEGPKRVGIKGLHLSRDADQKEGVSSLGGLIKKLT